MACDSMKKTLSIMMTAYDRAHLLGPTLESLHFQTRRADQIVVVEDGSDGGKTEAVCAQHKVAGLPIEYFRRVNRPAVGFSNPAVPKNIGIRKCTGEVIIIQGAEVKYTKSTDVENLVVPVEADPSVSMFAPCRSLNQDGSEGIWYGDPVHTHYLGFCHAVRRDRVIAIGGYDERFRGYGREDDDFAWRLHVSGITYKWAPEVLTIHQWHPGHPDPKDAENDKFNSELGGQVIEDYYKNKTRGLESNVGLDWGNINS